MDLTARLLALGVPHPFVITAPGFTAVRLAVEQQIRERGWSEALSPADADMLVLCGSGGKEFGAVAGRVWEQLPAPRTRTLVPDPDAASACLDAAVAALRDLEGLRRLEVDRPDAAPMDMDMAGSDSDKTGMDMDMDMELPGGLPMADRGADRDGLKLDQLHLVLGPALSDWPSGLVVRLVLQGDVAQRAGISVLDGAADGPPISSFWADLIGEAAQSEPIEHVELVNAAAAADSLQRFLNVAGWPSAARIVRRLRDELLAGAAHPAARSRAIDPRSRRWLRAVGRSRVLRWSVAGLGQLGPGQLDDGVPLTLVGDVTARVLRWVDDIAVVLDPVSTDAREAVVTSRAASARAALTVLPHLLVGQELAAVRLIVASLDPDIEALQAHAAAPRKSDG
ncbi:hypothetical protein IV500_13635 [Paeniglutamicibacter antarcticus]|uniref:Uncharacterized protein n=1 Tax=Arthrobacter terrae TaxID=2935737 RepID=A0A931CT48_9MICC|nr:hypothetical protein [Arthrobacter terrae]MBG0740424.1 hypothetical protein [Arthrobacter terrae]